MRERTVGLLCIILAAILFGTLGIFGKLAVRIDLSVTTLLAGRFVAASAVIWGVLLLRGRNGLLPPRTVASEIGLGVAYGVMSVAYFESLAWLSAGVAALLLFTYPVQVTFASALALEEPVTIPKFLALLAATLGVALVVSIGDGTVALPGVVLVGVASVCYTVYTMGTRIMIDDIAPLVHVGYVFVGVTMAVLGYGLATRSLAAPATPAGWALIAGITVAGTVVPLVFFTEGLARIEASRASIVSTSEPLTTVVLGIALLGEAVTASIAIGAVSILSGVVLTAPSAERTIRNRLVRLGVGGDTGRDT